MNFIKENKLISLVFSFLFLWGIWVTSQIYSQDKNVTMNEKEKQAVSETVKEIKTDIKEVKKEIRGIEEKLSNNQTEILKILLDIKRGQ